MSDILQYRILNITFIGLYSAQYYFAIDEE